MLTVNRQEHFEKLKYIFVDGYFAIFNKNFERKTIKKFILRNLQYHLLCFLSATCVSAVGYIYCKLFKKEKHIKTYLLLSFRPLYEQTYPFKIIKFNSMRFLFIVWWIMCYILIISYKTYLIEFRLKDPKIEYSLEDLVDEGFKFECYLDDYFYIKEECERVPSIFCKKLIPKSSYYIDTCEAFERMFDNRIAVIGEMHTIRYMVHFCTFTRFRQSEIKFSSNRVFGLQIHFWPLLKNSFLVEKFSEKVDLIEQAGLYIHWLRMELHIKTLGKDEKIPKEYTLALKDVFISFCLLSAGYMLSIIWFLGEIFKKK
ncbi:unnamed protein product [Psylliodes chrysocephalus]|uniref:Ionotropic receptor n=1 Tax=Psylliodes chrysocephalus TaxID=3402493 RepID=A0A9P0GCP3_9CUCU|nr:unnamed protein product [Psylliodes chrysocephala]